MNIVTGNSLHEMFHLVIGMYGRPVGSLCFNECVRCTRTRLSFLVTTYALTVCSTPLLLVKENLSPSNSVFCVPVPTSHTRVVPS